MAEQMQVDLIVNAITKGFDKVNKDLKNLNEQASKDTPKTAAGKWTEMASKLNLASAAFDMTTGAIKQTWAILEDGAALNLSRDRFERLSESIGSTSEAMLSDLSRASGGMMTSAEQIESASQIISLGLADNQKDVVDLASLVSELGWDMQQVILTFANNSKARLDALGLSVQDVEIKAKALEKQGYSTDKAFDLAVIQAGQEKLELLGSAADSGAGGMKRLEVKIIDLKNTILGFIAMRSEGVWTGLADVLDAVALANADLKKAYEMGFITQAEFAKGMIDVNTIASDGHTVLQKARGSLQDYEHAYADADTTMLAGVATYNAVNDARREAEAAAFREAFAIDEVKKVYAGLYRSEFKEHADKVNQQKDATLEYARAQQIANREMAEAADAERELAAAAKAAEISAGRLSFNQTFIDALENGAEAYGRFVTSSTAVGGRTEEQEKNFSDLQREAENLATNMNSLQGGTAGLGLSQEQVNEKLAEYQERLNHVNAAMQPLAEITTEYTNVQTKWQVDAEKLNNQLFNQIAATDLSAVSVVAAGIALGQYDETQISTALNAAIMQEKIDKLAEAFVNGDISAEEMRNEMDLIVEGSPYTAEIEAIVDKAKNALKEVKEGLDQIQSKTVTVTVRKSGADPGEGAYDRGGGGAAGGAAGGSSPPEGNRAVGGMVIAGHTYKVGESGMEYFTPRQTGMITPSSQATAAGQKTYTIVNHNYSQEAAAISYAQVERIRRARMDEI